MSLFQVRLDPVNDPKSAAVSVVGRRDEAQDDVLSALETPRFDAFANVHREAARAAARVNAGSTSEEEVQALLAERQALLDSDLEGTITPEQLDRLEYVRWSLDRIEDARHGAALDALEAHVSRYENLLTEIRIFASNIEKKANERKSDKK
jgi:hypothetical protein